MYFKPDCFVHLYIKEQTIKQAIVIMSEYENKTEEIVQTERTDEFKRPYLLLFIFDSK